MNRIFGFLQSSSSSTTENADTASPNLPASWYRSEAMYALERRAIFSKKWLMVSHNLRFANPGDYVKFHEAGFSFFLVRDREGNINGFHNVCRHRTFPLVREETGTASVLSCLYHGWSYELNGQLAKAPRYQNVAGFDKDKYALFPVHMHIDKLGFIWVNLETSETPSSRWEDEFAGIDEQPRLEPFEVSKYRFDHQWEMTRDYNWKTLADTCNERSKTDRPDHNGLGVSTFYFPNASITVSPHLFYIVRCVPISATQTQMQYEVYRHQDASDEDFNHIDGVFKQALKEDEDLGDGAQKNLNNEVYIHGDLHPQHEKGPLCFHSSVRKPVLDHRQTEEKQGKEIWPASTSPDTATKPLGEIDICEKLDCKGGGAATGPLSW